MSGQHALHKIIANCARPKSGKVTPGTFVEIEPDVFSVILSPNGSDAKKLMADLEELGVKDLPLKDRIFAVSDHASPAPTMQLAASQKLWRDFYRDKGVRVFDGGAGVSHLVLCEEGIALPGTLGIAIDSHGPTMGAVGMYATSLGGGRLTLYAIGRYFLEVPKVTLVKVHGSAKLARGVYGRDAALYVNGKLGQRGAYGNAVEFAGPFIDGLSMDMRFTFANMGVELGAVASYIQPDQTTLDWVKPRAKDEFKVYDTDADFKYDQVHEVDISGIEPQIAVPHKPDDVMPVSAVAGRKVVRVHAKVHPNALITAGKLDPRTPLEGKFSVPFCIALGLTGHAVVSTDFVEAKMHDARVMDIVPVVQLEAVDGQPPHSAHLDVYLADGDQLHGDTDIVIGHPDNPMSWDDLRVKFEGLTVPVIGADKARTLFETARAFEDGAIRKISALLAA